MAARRSTSSTQRGLLPALLPILCSSLPPLAAAYRPGDIVPMLRSGQYHGSTTVWFDVVGRNCPAFAVNREVLMPMPKATGFTGADPYKINADCGKASFTYICEKKVSHQPEPRRVFCWTTSSLSISVELLLSCLCILMSA